MQRKLSRWLDWLSEFLAARKGLLPLVGMAMVAANLLIQIFSGGWLAETDLFLHLGIIVALLGFLLSWAL